MSGNKPSPPTKPTDAPSAKARRSTNGLMLAVAVIAAVGIVVILNYVVYWQYRGMSPGARSYVRYDLTATRRYSLSEQSRGVIDSFGTDVRLVTMLGGESIGDEQEQRIRDLADEYARASRTFSVQHIALDTDSDQRAELLAEMDAMFSEDTASIRASIAEGLSQLDRYAKAVDQIESLLQKLIDSEVEFRPALIQQQRLADLHSQYLRLQDSHAQIIDLRNRMLGPDWATRLRSPGESSGGADLPDYTRLMVLIQRYIIQLTRQTLPDTPAKADALRRGVVTNTLASPERQQAALTAQNTLASLTQQVPELLKQLTVQADPLLTISPPLRYEDARSVLNDKPCVLLTSQGDARVLPAELLFRGTGTVSDGLAADLFVGEEQITGALISLGLNPPPLVVFVRSNTGSRAFSITGSDENLIDGVYDHVAKRLLAMDFEVVEWANPLRDEAPQPREGQRVVWVTMPYLKPDSTRRDTLDHARKDKVASHLKDRLAKGDGALVMLSFNPDTDPRLANHQDADSLVSLLRGYGVDAQVYHNVSRLSLEAEDASESVYSPEFIVRHWPDSAIVGEALSGIDTYFVAPMPVIPNAIENGPTVRPLIELTTPAMHVQNSIPDRETGAYTPEPGSEQERVTIGVAVEQEDMRLITVGEATWAFDGPTTLARLPDGKIGPELADEPGARLAYPGNTDLFVNSICWLAHQEDLIAASPRVQDVRRIDTLSDSTLQLYRLLLWGALPGIIFAAGVGVWLMRRRA